MFTLTLLIVCLHCIEAQNFGPPSGYVPPSPPVYQPTPPPYIPPPPTYRPPPVYQPTPPPYNPPPPTYRPPPVYQPTPPPYNPPPPTYRPPPVYQPTPPPYNPPPPVYWPTPPPYYPPPVYTPPPYGSPPGGYVPSNDDVQEAIGSCVDVLDEMKKDKRNKKNRDLYKKADKALKKVRKQKFDNRTLQQLSGNVQRMKKAAALYNDNCDGYSSGRLDYNTLNSQLGNDNEDDDSWKDSKGSMPIAKLKGVLDAACVCIEDYCGT
ncbi:unnamed protein product [Heligmosomoides polygyrus]|uniref:PMEI domain-containing protein n=1 Tax=Heligmosomoides polygyrus TaxID=6339 RepID=A0A183GFR5_HELPZ|nr:unnamed protein product [Heligmosomoides polygyrus]